jgi:hypothetical protein
VRDLQKRQASSFSESIQYTGKPYACKEDRVLRSLAQNIVGKGTSVVKDLFSRLVSARNPTSKTCPMLLPPILADHAAGRECL